MLMPFPAAAVAFACRHHATTWSASCISAPALFFVAQLGGMTAMAFHRGSDLGIEHGAPLRGACLIKLDESQSALGPGCSDLLERWDLLLQLPGAAVMDPACKYVLRVTVDTMTSVHTLQLNRFAQDSIQVHTSYNFCRAGSLQLL